MLYVITPPCKYHRVSNSITDSDQDYGDFHIPLDDIQIPNYSKNFKFHIRLNDVES